MSVAALKRMSAEPAKTRIPGSFRDPAGFVFVRDETIFRQVNDSYASTYDYLMQSGLYEDLASGGLLLPHENVGRGHMEGPEAYTVIAPEPLGFVSGPYEWSFSQLRDAALTTLEIQRRALATGMSLKDASSFNVQLHKARPTLIDTLSFELLDEEYPWVAYRQFCEQFLAPLAVMAYTDVRLAEMMQSRPNGFPLDLAAGLLPLRTRVNPGLAMHIHLHAKSQRRFAASAVIRRDHRGRMNLHRLNAMVDSLESAVRRLSWDPRLTSWADYRGCDSYDETGFEHKKRIVTDLLAKVEPREVWDLGCGRGEISRIALNQGCRVVAIDGDPGAVDLNYRDGVSNREWNMYPIVADLTNPSPALGWENQEYPSLLDRGPADAIVALALVHHLAIGNNVPLERLAQFFARMGKSLIIEFVPASDPRASQLLATRDHAFPLYTQEAFESTFRRLFQIDAVEKIDGSERTIYLMTRL